LFPGSSSVAPRIHAGSGGSVKGISHSKGTKAERQKAFPSFLPIISFPASDNSPTGIFSALINPCADTEHAFFASGVCADDSPHAFAFPCRYVHNADQGSLLIPPRHAPHIFSVRAGYQPAPLPIPPRHRHHVYQVRSRYELVPRLIRTRRSPHADIMRIRFRADACSFVRRYLRGPAYVSCTRAVARYIPRLARGCRPFESRQSQRPKP
jgi:hypothetical protein